MINNKSQSQRLFHLLTNTRHSSIYLLIYTQISPMGQSWIPQNANGWKLSETHDFLLFHSTVVNRNQLVSHAPVGSHTLVSSRLGLLFQPSWSLLVDGYCSLRVGQCFVLEICMEFSSARYEICQQCSVVFICNIATYQLFYGDLQKELSSFSISSYLASSTQLSALLKKCLWYKVIF